MFEDVSIYIKKESLLLLIIWVWYDFSRKKKSNHPVKILQMTSAPSPSFKIQESMNMWLFFISQRLTAWDKRSPVSPRSPSSVWVHWRLHVAVSHLCILNIGPGLASQPFCDVTNYTRKIRYTVSAEEMCTLSKPMWKTLSSVRLHTYVTLHTEA